MFSCPTFDFTDLITGTETGKTDGPGTFMTGRPGGIPAVGPGWHCSLSTTTLETNKK